LIEAVFLGTFTWAKLNLADMSGTGLNAEIRDTKEGTVYPAPIAAFPVLTGFGAGYPDGGEPLCFGRDELLLVLGTVEDTELKVEPHQEHKHG